MEFPEQLYEPYTKHGPGGRKYWGSGAGAGSGTGIATAFPMVKKVATRESIEKYIMKDEL